MAPIRELRDGLRPRSDCRHPESSRPPDRSLSMSSACSRPGCHLYPSCSGLVDRPCRRREARRMPGSTIESDIARELNVDGIVEGAVIRSGERVRVDAQLIEASTDRHFWAKAYERNLS